MNEDFGKGFTTTNLKNMRTLYLTSPKGHTLCDLLMQSHCRPTMRVANKDARQYYYEKRPSSIEATEKPLLGQNS